MRNLGLILFFVSFLVSFLSKAESRYSVSISESHVYLYSWGAGNFGRLKMRANLNIIKDSFKKATIPIELIGTVTSGYKLLFGLYPVKKIAILGLNDEITLGDIFTSYFGNTSGGSYLIPGPCCIMGGSRIVDGTSVNGKLRVILDTNSGVGWETDRTNINFTISNDSLINFHHMKLSDL